MDIGRENDLLNEIAKLESALRQNYLLATQHILTQLPEPVRNGAYLKLSNTMRELGLL